jgi:amino acid transporter
VTRNLRRGSLNALTLALTVFCCVSGGPYGLEQTVQTAGPGLAVLLILLVPLVWALPDALTTAELAPAIPEEGGYVVWVRRAMGPFWGFVNAWWTWMYALIDATIYPVLFATYLSRLLADAGVFHGVDQMSLFRWIVAATVVAAFTVLNIRGTNLVGKASSIFAVIIIVPFVILGVLGLYRAFGESRPLIQSFVPKGASVQSALADGLGLVMWNYLGWDALSTVAEEVDRPAFSYPRALLIGVPLVTAVYLLPVLGSLPFVPDPSKWTEGAWPDIARIVVGPWLGFTINCVGLVSAAALFTASLLGSSRIPFVLAEAGFLPNALVQIHPRYGTPARALILCGAIYVLLAAFESFRDLVELNVILYGAALLLEIASLLVLRKREPDLPRPFRIGGGWPVLWLIFLGPAFVILTMAYVSIREDGLAAQALDLGLLASGPVVYVLVKAFKRTSDGQEIGA